MALEVKNVIECMHWIELQMLLAEQFITMELYGGCPFNITEIWITPTMAAGIE